MAKHAKLYVHSRGWVHTARDGHASCDVPPTAQDWSEAGHALQEEFGRARVRVLMSGTLARFVSVPWQDGIAGPAAWENYAREFACALLGVGADDAECRFGWPDHGRPIAVVVYPKRLVAAIGQGLAVHGHALDGVGTSGVEAFYYWLRSGRADGAEIVVDEADGALGISIRNRAVSAIEVLDGGEGRLNGPELWLARRQVNQEGRGECLWWSRRATPALPGISTERSPQRSDASAASTLLGLMR